MSGASASDPLDEVGLQAGFIPAVPGRFFPFAATRHWWQEGVPRAGQTYSPAPLSDRAGLHADRHRAVGRSDVDAPRRRAVRVIATDSKAHVMRPRAPRMRGVEPA